MEKKIRKINVQILNIKNGMLHIEGKLTRESYIRGSSGDVFTLTPEHERYSADLPLKDGEEYRFFRKVKGEECELTIRHGKFSRLTELDNSHFIHDGHIIMAGDNSIKIAADSFRLRHSLSRGFEKTLASLGQSEAVQIRKKAAALKKSGRPIWIMSDRSDMAGDNGQALFEFLMKNDIRDKVDIYFLIGRDSPDFEKISATGPVIPVGSEEQKVKVLAADIIISSSGDDWIVNPFGKDKMYYRDMMTAKYVFLQHGVIKDDLSGWLNVLKKNITIFITSAWGEYESICTDSYGYTGDVVKLTGLARFDKLTDRRTKTITIMPTWRKALAPPLIPGTSEREYDPAFRESGFFEFYNALINDEKLIAAMNEAGYTGTFYLHPNHINQIEDFTENETIRIHRGKPEFTKVFNESSLLITDYSSVATDFAYMRKPIIYTQFDKDTFYETHSYVEGYYDYERDGFGPVCYDFESTRDAIIDEIRNDCAGSDFYRNRIDSFFAHSDQGNCQRTLDEILKL